MAARDELTAQTIKSSLSWAVAANVAALDAEVLLATVLKLSRAALQAWPERSLTTVEQKYFMELVSRRLQGEPVAYITGQKEFWSLTLSVTPDTLIPRPETELLVEWMLKKLSSAEHHLIADLGTGSGAIAIALAHECKNWQVHATDQSAAALAVARQNAARYQLSNITFHAGDWCAALPLQNFVAIISNPPYIAALDPELEWAVAQFEPQAALLAAEAGLSDLRQIIQQAKEYLQTDGYLIVEHGSKQAAAVRELFAGNGYHTIESLQDLAGLDRATSAQISR
jgi:release factor glutamine methyltransferase